ncbi:putative bifunctional diguanylate cyclase/phosphodiesterase [Gluconacetobacter sacchari]|uniref:EAL domain-containing protein n=2 Tax=Gluconacetobacter sacchari TaxID=92759 RepID=A0A7W4I9B8_9PROT|nr:EAL domain-containing protein [Gluconacetobacter sacchari]MBB2158663.1 EAL domain-containing protein [Gluconacetobacter sacchari]GBQ18938.1 diguanylate cyclase [Gluconacetobacter sacchari DSM 12717]
MRFSARSVVTSPEAGPEAGGTPPGRVDEPARLSARDASLLAGLIDDVLIVAITDATGKITYVNDRFCEISQYSRAELLGATHRIVNSGYYDAAFFREMYATLRAGQAWHGTFRNRAKDGSHYWVATTIMPRYGPDGVIDGFIATRYDVTELVQARMRLDALAVTDPLTGLANRTGFLDGMSAAMRRMARTGAGETYLLMFDLDGFKRVNDSHGHYAGDMVLCAIANRLAALVDPADIVCRLGGDEFALIVDRSLTATTLDQFLDRVQTVIAEPVDLGSGTVALSGSIGVLPLAGYSSIDEAQKHADYALYAAKRAGGRQVRLFETDLRRAVNRRSETIAEARDGLATNAFEVYFQPVMESATRCVGEFEALMRWHHPSQGLLPAASFMEVLADTQMTATMVARMTCALVDALARFRTLSMGTVGEAVRLGVNLSRADLFGAVSQRTLTDQIVQRGLVPRDFVLEVPSRLLQQGRRAGHVAERVDELAATGFRIALDGLGEGPVDFQAMRGLPFTSIKLWPGFVQGVTERVEARRMLRAMIELVHACGMTVCVKGVETAQQAEIALELGADAIQGYVLSRPLSVEDVLTQMSRWTAPMLGFNREGPA